MNTTELLLAKLQSHTIDELCDRLIHCTETMSRIEEDDYPDDCDPVDYDELQAERGMIRSEIKRRVNQPSSIPTFDGDNYDDSRQVPITVRTEGGLRIILGRPDDSDAPDVFIERHNGHWEIALHPGDGDPTGTIRLRDGEINYQYDPEWGGSPAYLLTRHEAKLKGD